MSKYFEQLKVGGKFLGTSITVTESHIVFYGCLVGDLAPLHMNAEYVKKHSPFGTRIAHGMLTASLVVPSMANLDAHIIHHLGEKFAFKGPVLIGDTISAEWEVIRLTPKKEWGIVDIQMVVQNQRGEVILVGESTVAVRYAPKGQ